MVRDAHWHYHDRAGYGIEESLKYFDNFMKKYDIEAATILALPFRDSKSTSVLSKLTTLWIKDMMYPRIFAYMGLWHNFDESDTPEGYVSQLENGLKMGFEGVKMLEGKPDLRRRFGRRLDDGILDKFYSRAEELQVPIIMHALDPKSNWDDKNASDNAKYNGWVYTSDEYRSFEEIFSEVESVVTKHPKLKLILAHFFFLGDDLDRASAFLDKHPSVAFDLTPGTEMFCRFSEDSEKAKGFFEKYFDRLYFGTDFENVDSPVWREGNFELVYKFLTEDKPFVSRHGKEITPISLSPEIANRILCSNHVALHGKTPKTNNKELIKEEIKRIEQLKHDFSEREKHEFELIKKYYE